MNEAAKNLEEKAFNLSGIYAKGDDYVNDTKSLIKTVKYLGDKSIFRNLYNNVNLKRLGNLRDENKKIEYFFNFCNELCEKEVLEFDEDNHYYKVTPKGEYFISTEKTLN